MSKDRGATPMEDWAMGNVEEGVIKEVCPYSDAPGWSVIYGHSMGCGVRDCGVEPKIGDTLTTFGRFGRPFYGQALNGQVLWYLTPEEEAAERQREREEAIAKKKAEFEKNQAQLDADYESLPDTFKERIDKFRRTNPDFRVEFESYEMFCCKEALKIASYCSVNRIAQPEDGHEPTADENLTAFWDLPYDQQKDVLSDGHSGNTFGFSLRLAHWWVTDPGMVVQEHGALTPLVGCVAYGCPHGEA